MTTKKQRLLGSLPPPWDKATAERPLVMSHRAGGNEAPENTLAALRAAEAAGSRVRAHAVLACQCNACKQGHACNTMFGVSEQVMQMDVLATADGTPVVFHDINLKRATGEDIDIRTVRRLSHCLAKADDHTGIMRAEGCACYLCCGL